MGQRPLHTQKCSQVEVEEEVEGGDFGAARCEEQRRQAAAAAAVEAVGGVRVHTLMAGLVCCSGCGRYRTKSAAVPNISIRTTQ